MMIMMMMMIVIIMIKMMMMMIMKMMMVCKFLKRVGLVLFSDVYVMDGNNYKAGQHFYKGCDNTYLGR